MENNKNILTVAPLLADRHESCFDMEQYQQFINSNESHLGSFSKYLVCKLHDSWVINTSISDNLFSVTLNDFSTYVFAKAIIKKMGLSIDLDLVTFPVQLDFKTESKVVFNEVDLEGNLMEVESVRLDEYLYEQILSIDNEKTELALSFWEKHDDEKHGRGTIIALLTASEIVISERQDLAWKQIFGLNYDNYYQYFKNQFVSGRYLSDYNECLKLIEEYDTL